ncbi:hypothetical protein SDC9_126981 [bioreactor metagenome]|uniref:Uncharacterized protein n=1 Tax=bioreactor metagenome TaxID=1076179 RepID=A0A645CSU6_9ZZZZ
MDNLFRVFSFGLLISLSFHNVVKVAVQCLADFQQNIGGDVFTFTELYIEAELVPADSCTGTLLPLLGFFE